jgi:hypothetical protein
MWLWYGQPFPREKGTLETFSLVFAERESKSVAGGSN